MGNIILAAKDYIFIAKYALFMLAALFVLYLLLLFSRFAGSFLTKKSYERYKKDYFTTHDSEDKLMTYEEFLQNKKPSDKNNPDK